MPKPRRLAATIATVALSFAAFSAAGGEPEPASTRVFWRAECLFEVDTKTLELTIKSCARPGDGIEI